MVNATSQPLCPQERKPGTHCMGGWVGPGLLWRGQRKYRISQPIGSTVIFSLEILEKIMMNVF